MEFAQGEPQHVALGADRLETGRAGRGVGWRDRAQRQTERIGIVGLDRRHAFAREAEAGQDRLRQRDGAHQTRGVVARLAAQEKAQRGSAIGESGRDRFEPHLRHFVYGDGQDMRGQAVAVPRQGIDQIRAMLSVMQQHDRLPAARFAIGRKQHAQLAHQDVCRRQRVGRSPGGAGGGALAAARADMGVDGDMIARGRDRAGRAEIEAAAAADDLGTRMRAKILGELDVARFVEGADEVPRLQRCTQHRSRITGIGAQIAFAQIGRRE